MDDRLLWHGRVTSKIEEDGLLGSLTPDPVEQERLAQLQEHKKRERLKGQGGDGFNRSRQTEKFRGAQRKPQPKIQPKAATFEKNLERTNKWLARTFPDLFGEQGPVLDLNILRDIKQHYKSHQEAHSKKNQYPKNLVIKAALNRYLATDDYLLKLKAEAKRYSLKGDECGLVTKEEAKIATGLLEISLKKR